MTQPQDSQYRETLTNGFSPNPRSVGLMGLKEGAALFLIMSCFGTILQLVLYYIGGWEPLKTLGPALFFYSICIVKIADIVGERQ